jgi:two-component system phosphate regulon sensor histidine kinase PhoR
MIKRSIVVIILIAVISLGLITAGQVYWVRQAYQLQERVFESKVTTALTDVATKIHLIENDKSLLTPAKRINDSRFLVVINHTPDSFLLRTLLEKELILEGLVEPVEYGLYDCFTGQFEVSGWLFADSLLKQANIPSGLMASPEEGHYLSLYFPQKNVYLLKRIDFWMYSTGIIFLIFVFFAYTIGVLFREKRLGSIRNDFVNNMTHELKTPLATIQLSAEVLKQDKTRLDVERMNTYIGIIETETQRLKDQLEKVLQLSSLTPRKRNIQWECFDVHAIIRDAYQANLGRVEDAGGHLHLSLDAVNGRIKADRVHISNIIYNLMDNAIKYTDKVPQIQVSTYNTKNCIRIDFKDNGIGINRRQQRLIFDRFYRVPTGDIHDVKGFGLGLFYVKTMLKAQKGKIFVKSELGKGSVFTLELPLSKN